MWILAAALSACFAGLTAIFAKCGIKKTDSDVATALRTIVVLQFAWIMVFIDGSVSSAANIDMKSLFFTMLSGLATGASWLCYFKALSIGDVNKVVSVDKLSTVLVVLIAIIAFNETRHLTLKLICTAAFTAGVYVMVEKKQVSKSKQGKWWVVYAGGSAIFAALTSILAKIGITNVQSNLATAIRTFVVLVMAWLVVFVKGKRPQIKALDKKEVFYIFLSGISTGISWLCYYYAIQNGIVSVVVPIDKLSIVITILFSYFILKEKLNIKTVTGLLLMVCGTLILTI